MFGRVILQGETIHVSSKQILEELLDIDRFKRVNDKYGHDNVDLLLAAFATRLKGLIRKGDTIGRLGEANSLFCLMM